MSVRPPICTSVTLLLYENEQRHDFFTSGEPGDSSTVWPTCCCWHGWAAAAVVLQVLDENKSITV